MDSQAKSYFHNLNHLADFHLKYCILKEMARNKSTGRNIAIYAFEKS